MSENLHIVSKNNKELLDSLLNGPSRFQLIEQREERSVLSADVIKASCRGRYIATYRDCALMKTPEDQMIYQQFLSLVKPKTVIELGTYAGGSALWMADMSNIFGNTCHIYSMDIDPSLIADQAIKLKPDNLTFVEGDCFAIEKAFNPDFLTKASHPLVLIEDAHHNTEAILHYFHEYLKPCDYIIAEDTHPDVPELSGMFAEDPNYKTFGTWKLRTVQKFLETYKGQYAVDSFLLICTAAMQLGT